MGEDKPGSSIEEAIAGRLGDLCGAGQEVQVFAEANVRKHAGPWRAYNVACVEGGETASLHRAWATAEVVEDAEAVVVQGRPLKRSQLRRIVDSGAKLRPVAELVATIALPEQLARVHVEDLMAEPGTPDQRWKGVFRYPRVTDGHLEFEGETKDGRFVRVRALLGGEGAVEPELEELEGR